MKASEWKYKIGDIVNNYKILSDIFSNKSQQSCVKAQCLKCNIVVNRQINRIIENEHFCRNIDRYPIGSKLGPYRLIRHDEKSVIVIVECDRKHQLKIHQASLAKISRGEVHKICRMCKDDKDSNIIKPIIITNNNRELIDQIYSRLLPNIKICANCSNFEQILQNGESIEKKCPFCSELLNNKQLRLMRHVYNNEYIDYLFHRRINKIHDLLKQYYKIDLADVPVIIPNKDRDEFNDDIWIHVQFNAQTNYMCWIKLFVKKTFLLIQMTALTEITTKDILKLVNNREELNELEAVLAKYNKFGEF